MSTEANFHSLYRKGDKGHRKTSADPQRNDVLLQAHDGQKFLGYYTFILDDGTKRNARRLKRAHEDTPSTESATSKQHHDKGKSISMLRTLLNRSWQGVM